MTPVIKQLSYELPLAWAGKLAKLDVTSQTECRRRKHCCLPLLRCNRQQIELVERSETGKLATNV